MPHKRAKRSIRDTATAARGYDNAPTASDSYTVPYPVASTSATLANEPKKSNKSRKAPKELDSFGGRKDLGGLSKSLHRILNAEAVRDEYQQNKKRKREDEEKATAKKGNKKALVMLPYESLGAFNRRVESTLRPDIDVAIKASKSANKKRSAKKSKLVDPSLVDDAATAAAAKPNAKGGKPSLDPLVPPPKPQIVRNGPTEFARPSQIKNITDVAMAPPTLKKRKDFALSMSDPLPGHRMPVSASIKLAMEREREKAVNSYRLMKEKRDAEQRKEQES